MKVCIIGHTERNYIPYLEKYARFFDGHGVDYDVICWQRENCPASVSEGDLTFYEEEKEGVFNKVRSYLRFSRHVRRLVRERHYDKLVILTTVPALFLRRLLHTEYRGRYLFDFRDYSHERFGPYRRLVDRVIRESELTTISSRGFLDFLTPSPRICMNHNIGDWEPSGTLPDLREKQVVNIGFIGGVRYFEENVCLIEKLKNAFRYQLWYIGKPHADCDLPSYCAQHEVTNVSFVGKFDNSQKPELYRSIDLINSIYGDASLEVTTALPNRLYEACLFKKPIISSRGTYLGEVICQYHLGLAVDVETDDVRAILDEYLDHFDREAFLSGCEAFLQTVREEETHLYRALSRFIGEETEPEPSETVLTPVP